MKRKKKPFNKKWFNKHKYTLKIIFLVIPVIFVWSTVVLQYKKELQKPSYINTPHLTKSFEYIFTPKDLRPKVKLYIDEYISNYKQNFYTKISKQNTKQGNLFIYTQNQLQDENKVSFDLTFVTDDSKEIIKERRHFDFDNHSQKLLNNIVVTIPKIKTPQISNVVDCSKEKCVALTFDDGPHTNQTIKLLNELDESNTKATFFVLGNRVGKDPDVLLREYESGHEIGNHTYDHKAITTLKDEEVLEEITKTDNLLYFITGNKSKILRPPYGAIYESQLHLIQKPVILWTFDLQDWLADKDTTEILQDCENKIKPGSIILMHDIRNTTIDVVPLIIKSLSKKGYKFVTVSNLLGVTNNYSKYNNLQIHSINDKISK